MAKNNKSINLTRVRQRLKQAYPTPAEPDYKSYPGEGVACNIIGTFNLSSDGDYSDDDTDEILKIISALDEIKTDREAVDRIEEKVTLCSEMELATNLKVACKALFEQGIHFVKFDFEGGGDEGCVEKPEFFRVATGEEWNRNNGLFPCHDGAVPVLPVPDGYEDVGVSWVKLGLSSEFVPVERRRKAIMLSKAIDKLGDIGVDGILGQGWYDGSDDTSGSLFIETGHPAFRMEYAQMEWVDKKHDWVPQHGADRLSLAPDAELGSPS